ncbi:DUF6077 domain-containing protein [Diplocloster hominis]|uniref:DUF6077 domain-containing protein n=1 Tax=Diplocloster hominis TaxID=3079010 RepID=UPI0031BBA4EC
MFLIKIGIIFLFLLVMPIIWGIVLNLYYKTDHVGIVFYYVAGWMGILSLFGILAIPMTFLYVKFNYLVLSWAIFVFLIPIVLLLLRRILLPQNKALVFHFNLKQISWLYVIALLLIAAQIFMVTFFQHVDDDDAFYVGTAVTSWQTNTMFQYAPYTGEAYDMFPSRYVLSPFPLLYAALANISGFHPTIIAHTILPLFLILLCYGAVYLVGTKLFKCDRNKIAVFLILVCLLNIWGNASDYTVSSFLLFRIWQGKSLLVNAMLPYCLYLVLTVKENNRVALWVNMAVANMAACVLTSMGVFLFPMFLGLQIIVLCFELKNISIVWKAILACTPSLIFGCIYLIIR